MSDLARARTRRGLLVLSLTLGTVVTGAPAALAAASPSSAPATATVGMSPSPSPSSLRQTSTVTTGTAPKTGSRVDSPAPSSPLTSAPAEPGASAPASADPTLAPVEGVAEEDSGLPLSGLLPWLAAAASIALTGAGLRRLLATPEA